jgi:hypothetical protein
MTVLVACETVLLALLVLLVVGLLRSHAEILRRLGPVEEGDAQIDQSLPQPGRRAGVREAHDIVGTTLAGDAVKLGLGAEAPPTLLAFLSSGCLTCERFWGDLRSGRTPRELPGQVRIMPVVKGAEQESPGRLAELAGETVPFVMSSSAWSDYGVPGAPYFVYLQGGRVHGEGSASSWQQISSLLRDAIADGALAGGGERRTREVDRILAASGIGPEDSSLYPGGRG